MIIGKESRPDVMSVEKQERVDHHSGDAEENGAVMDVAHSSSDETKVETSERNSCVDCDASSDNSTSASRDSAECGAPSDAPAAPSVLNNGGCSAGASEQKGHSEDASPLQSQGAPAVDVVNVTSRKVSQKDVPEHGDHNYPRNHGDTAPVQQAHSLQQGTIPHRKAQYAEAAQIALSSPSTMNQQQMLQPKIAKKKGRFSIIEDNSMQPVGPDGVVPSSDASTSSNYVLNSAASVSLPPSSSSSPTTVPEETEAGATALREAHAASTGDSAAVGAMSKDHAGDVAALPTRVVAPNTNVRIPVPTKNLGLGSGIGGPVQNRAVPASSRSDSTSPPIIISAAAVVDRGTDHDQPPADDVSSLSSAPPSTALEGCAAAPPRNPQAAAVHAANHVVRSGSAATSKPPLSAPSGLSASGSAATQGAPPKVQKKGRFMVINSAPHQAPEAPPPSGMNVTAAVGLIPSDKGLTPVSVVAIPPVSPSAVVELGDVSEARSDGTQQSQASLPNAQPKAVGRVKPSVESMSVGGAGTARAPAPPPSHPFDSRITSTSLDMKGGGGLGKVLYFLDQMKLEVTEADKVNRNLLKDVKFLREKNKELEARSRDLEKRLADEKTLRENAEAKCRHMKKKLHEFKKKDALNSEAPNGGDISEKQHQNIQTRTDSCAPEGEGCGNSFERIRNLKETDSHVPTQDSGNADDTSPCLPKSKSSDDICAVETARTSKDSFKPPRTFDSSESPALSPSDSKVHSCSRDVPSEALSGCRTSRPGVRVSGTKPPLPAPNAAQRNHAQEMGSAGSSDSLRGGQNESPRKLKLEKNDKNLETVHRVETPKRSTTSNNVSHTSMPGNQRGGTVQHNFSFSPGGSAPSSQRDPLTVANQSHPGMQQKRQSDGSNDGISVSGGIAKIGVHTRVASSSASDFDPLVDLSNQQGNVSGSEDCEKVPSNATNGCASGVIQVPCVAYQFDPLTASNQAQTLLQQVPPSSNVAASGTKVRKNSNSSDFDPLKLAQKDPMSQSDSELNDVCEDGSSTGSSRFPSRQTSETGPVGQGLMSHHGGTHVLYPNGMPSTGAMGAAPFSQVMITGQASLPQHVQQMNQGNQVGHTPNLSLSSMGGVGVDGMGSMAGIVIMSGTDMGQHQFAHNMQQQTRDNAMQPPGATTSVHDPSQLSSSWPQPGSSQPIANHQVCNQQQKQMQYKVQGNGQPLQPQQCPQGSDPFDELAVRRTATVNGQSQQGHDNNAANVWNNSFQ